MITIYTKQLHSSKFLQILGLLLPAVLIVEKCGAVLLTVPKSRTALIGQRVEFSCNTNASRPFNWFFISSENFSKSYENITCAQTVGIPSVCTRIARHGEVVEQHRQRYNLSRWTMAGELSMLSINLVDFSYAGAYECSAGYECTAMAHLTVIDPTPECECNKLSEACERSVKNSITCNFNYSGSSPDIKSNAADPGYCCAKNDVIICTLDLLQSPTCSDRDRVTDHDTKSTVTPHLLCVSLNASNCTELSTNWPTTVRNEALLTDDISTKTNSSISSFVLPSALGVLGILIVIAIILVVIKLYRISKTGNASTGASDLRCDRTIVETQIDESGSEHEEGMTPVYAAVDKRNGKKSSKSTPIYSPVNKKDRSNGSKEAPVYSEVNKDQNLHQNGKGKPKKADAPLPDFVICENNMYYNSGKNTERQTDPKAPERPPRSVQQSDNIIYTELGTVALHCPARAPVNVSEFNASEYAAIDHTLQVVPPPPKLHSNRR